MTNKAKYDEGYVRAFGHAGPTGSVKGRVYGFRNPAKVDPWSLWPIEFLPILPNAVDMESMRRQEQEFIKRQQQIFICLGVPRKALGLCQN